MLSRRSVAFVGTALLLAAPTACKKTNTNVTVAGPGGGSESAHTERGPSQPSERPPIEKIQLGGSVSGVGDMLDAGSKLLNMWSPPEPGMPAVNIRDFIKISLIQEGFGPGFFESIDLDGVHAVEFAFPHEGQPYASDADIELAMTTATINGARMIESMPAAMQPQPLGQNLWQLVEEEAQLFFRAQSNAMEIAMSMEDLDRAGALRAQVPAEPRLRVRASNLPAGDIDVSDMIPVPGGGADIFSAILNETTAMALLADFGTNRDLTAVVEASAPFERLGLDPIGPATQAESKLAKALPPDAMAVWLMPWGDPGLLHQILDKRIPVNEIPAPFDGYASDVIHGMHGVLGAIDQEVLMAPYLDSKGNLTLVFAAGVKDEDGARKAVREVFGAADKAFQDHIALTGTSPDHTYKVSFKKDGVKAGKFKGDLFTLTVPKDKQKDLEGAAWFVGKKPKLEVAVIVADGKLVMAMGVGQKSFMSALGKRLGKSGDAGLESGGGLALARKLAGGCQYCVTVDPIEVGEMVFTVIANDPDEPAEVQKAAKTALAKLGKLGIEGEVAMAARLDTGKGAFGFGIPKQLLFSDPDKIKAVVELFKSLDEAREKAAGANAKSAAP